MLIRSNYTIKIFNNNNSSFIYSRNECVKYIFSMNSSFHYKSLTAYKAIFYFDYIMNNNTIDKENIPIIALCCYILSVKFCENDPLIPNTIKYSCYSDYSCSKKIRELFVFKKIRVLSVLISVCNKIFVLFGLLLPFGQWAYGESRVQKTESATLRTRSVKTICSFLRWF